MKILKDLPTPDLVERGMLAILGSLNATLAILWWCGLGHPDRFDSGATALVATALAFRCLYWQRRRPRTVGVTWNVQQGQVINVKLMINGEVIADDAFDVKMTTAAKGEAS